MDAPRKNGAGTLVDKILNGVAFVNVARSALVLVRDDEAKNLVLAVAKSNLGGTGSPGMIFVWNSPRC